MKTAVQSDPLLGQFGNTVRFNSLRYQVGQAMFCKKCDDLMDVNDAVSLDYIGKTTGKLHSTICLCGKCADAFDASDVMKEVAGKIGEEIIEERFDGREFDEDGFPINMDATFAGVMGLFTTRHAKGLVRVSGRGVTFAAFPGLEFFIYQMPLDDGSGGNFHVIEVTTGLGAGKGATIKGAARAAFSKMTEVGLEKVMSTIAQTPKLVKEVV